MTTTFTTLSNNNPITANNTVTAWELAYKYADIGNYELDTHSRAGYPIYRSTDCHFSYICDLGNRLEVNKADNTTVNIWIKKEVQEVEQQKTETLKTTNFTHKTSTPKVQKTKTSHYKKLSMEQRDALSITSKQSTIQRNFDRALIDGKSREAFDLSVQIAQYDNEIQAIYNAITPTDDPLYSVTTMLAIVTLKVLARGHIVIDRKTGKPKLNENGETMTTPINMQAIKLLQKGKNDTSGIFEDILQEVYIKAYEAYTNGYITIVEKTLDDGRIIKALNPTENAPENVMRDIMNVVQSYLYQNAQKHYRHLYTPQFNEDGEELDPTPYTLAQRQYEMSIEYIGADELIKSLKVKLSDNEFKVLQALLETKQEEISYTSNGKQKRHYVTQKLTLDEISKITSLSIQTVRTCKKNIQKLCSDFLK